MALFKTQITPTYCLGIWKIEENLDYFFENYFLTDLEAEQFSLLNHEKKQIERMAGRLLIKNLLKMKNLNFEGVLNHETGKPYLINLPYEISISHSNEFVAVIISLTNEAVGIDLQQFDEKINIVAPRLFSEDEMKDCADSLLKKSIYWSAKEALYKIHQLRKLDFKKDLRINSFPLQEKGRFNGFLQDKSFAFYYELWDNYVLVYNCP